MVELAYGVDVEQMRQYVVRPACLLLEMHSESAEVLVLGTGLTESQLRFVDQIDRENKDGPAYGFWQMEERTFRDIFDNYLRHQWDLRGRLQGLCTHSPRVQDMRWNLIFAAAMCRIHYRRVREPLPPPDDAAGMARYWKEHYNTPLGRGTVEKALPHFKRAAMGAK